MTIMKRVSNLKCVNSVSVFCHYLLMDLLRSHSVLVHAVVEFNVLDEAHLGSCDQVVTLAHNVFGFRVLEREGPKYPCAYLLLSIFVKDRIFYDRIDVLRKCGTLQCNLLFTLQLLHLLLRAWLRYRNREEMSLVCVISQSLHLHDFQQLHLIHKLSQWISPSLSECLQVFRLLDIDI